MTLVIIKVCCIFIFAEEAKPTIASIDSSTGLYFDEMGQIFFYLTKWEVVRYVNLKPTQTLWKQVKAHQLQTANCCFKSYVYWTVHQLGS